MKLLSQEITSAYECYAALCATTTATNRQVNMAWRKYQRLIKQYETEKEQARQVTQVALGLPVLYAWVGENPGPEWYDRFVGMVTGNVHIVMSRNNKYDGHVDSFILSHDNYFANVLTANRGRLAVNESDHARKGFTDVSLAVALYQLDIECSKGA